MTPARALGCLSCLRGRNFCETPATTALRPSAQRSSQLLAEELRRLGWQDADLAARPKSDPAKLALAARLRKETTLSIKAIAARVHLGASKSAKARLREWMKGAATATLSPK